MIVGREITLGMDARHRRGVINWSHLQLALLCQRLMPISPQCSGRLGRCSYGLVFCCYDRCAGTTTIQIDGCSATMSALPQKQTFAVHWRMSAMGVVSTGRRNTPSHSICWGLNPKALRASGNCQSPRFLCRSEASKKLSTFRHALRLSPSRDESVASTS